MTNQDLILQLKTLQSIQPDKKWAKQAKAHILNQPQPYQETFSIWQGIRTRAFLVAPAFIAVIIIGVFFYNIDQNPQETASLELIASELKIAASNFLEAVDSLEKVQTPENAVEIKQKVFTAIESGQKVVATAKKIAEIPEQASPQVLAAITIMEGALEDVEENYAAKQKQLAGQLIKDLKTRELTENQAIALEQAEKYYNDNNFAEALIKALEAWQNK